MRSVCYVALAFLLGVPAPVADEPTVEAVEPRAAFADLFVSPVAAAAPAVAASRGYPCATLPTRASRLCSGFIIFVASSTEICIWRECQFVEVLAHFCEYLQHSLHDDADVGCGAVLLLLGLGIDC